MTLYKSHRYLIKRYKISKRLQYDVPSVLRHRSHSPPREIQRSFIFAPSRDVPFVFLLELELHDSQHSPQRTMYEDSHCRTRTGLPSAAHMGRRSRSEAEASGFQF